MGKSSTNSGKHPYLRADKFQELFGEIIQLRSQPDRRITETITHKFINIIQTEYLDKNKEPLYFGDVVSYHGNDYLVDYDSKFHHWIIKNTTKLWNLASVADSVILKEKYSFR